MQLHMLASFEVSLVLALLCQCHAEMKLDDKKRILCHAADRGRRAITFLNQTLKIKKDFWALIE